MPPRAKRVRLFTFTFFHYSPIICDRIEQIDCKWMIYQTEKCPTSGLHHLQGALYFKNPLTILECKALFPMDTTRTDSVHIEVAVKSAQIQQGYCSKNDSRLPFPIFRSFEKGMVPSPGQRTDLDLIMKLIRDTPNIQELNLWELFPPLMMQYGRRILHYQSLLVKHLPVHKVCTVLWGETGTGKSHQCTNSALLMEDNPYYLPTGQSGVIPWADGYLAQRAVIIEDYAGGIPLRLLLRMLDKYPLLMAVKGSFVKWVPTHIWISSNLHPRDWYTDELWIGGPLQRRLTSYGSTITKLTEVYSPPLVEIDSD